MKKGKDKKKGSSIRVLAFFQVPTPLFEHETLPPSPLETLPGFLPEGCDHEFWWDCCSLSLPDICTSVLNVT